MDLNSSVIENVCPVCGIDKGAQLFNHLFNAHGFTKDQIGCVKRERRQRRVLTAGKPVITCDICGSLFTHIIAYNAHQRTKHPEEHIVRNISCPLCEAEMPNHQELARHARLSHATEEDDYVVEKLVFTSKQEYKLPRLRLYTNLGANDTFFNLSEWKQASEEANVISRFVSTIKHSNNVKTTYMRCSRALRSFSIVPTITRKTVAYCTAYMKVIEDGMSISVEHCFTHCGHDVNPAKLRLDEKSQQYIASLLKEGASVKQVKEKLRTKMREGPKNRLYFTTSRDIRNIANKCRVQPGRLHNLDTVSVQMRVDANAQSDGLQIYKPAQNASGDGFLLVIITPTQRTWLARYGRRALCIDDTFNLTSYSLRLATVVVADEWDKALPAAYLLSYRMTEIEIGVLFEQVKKHLPSFHTDYIMTDDTNTFWNGFAKAFPITWTKKLLCLWHVQQAMKRNATSKLIKSELLEPFMRKVREICLIRDKEVFLTKYTSLLKYLRDQSEATLANYMENSWSDRIDQWAAFGRLGSCVSTSMLCERFHKTLKHGILEGKANVRIDSLLELLIKLTTEAEEEREIAMERGVEEGRYRLQQHHKSHSAAVAKYAGKQDLIVIAGNGQWEVKDNGHVYNVREQFCPCDSEAREQKNIGLYDRLHYGIVIDSSDEEELVDLQEAEPLYVEDDEEDTVLLRRRSTDNRDKAKDALQEIEMTYAASRTKILAMSSRCSDEALQAIEEVKKRMKEDLIILAAAETQLFGEENDIRLARRAEVSSVGRPQGFTPIRKLHKRSHLRRCEQAKRLKPLDIPDCAPDERDSCAICLRMQPSNSQCATINWIQCPQCEDWMHIECVGSTCPKDGANLEDT